MVLGRAFAAANTYQEAFVLYESTRKERANGVQLASRRQADEIQGVTARGPNPGTDSENRGLYSYNPVVVPLTRAGETRSIQYAPEAPEKSPLGRLVICAACLIYTQHRTFRCPVGTSQSGQLRKNGRLLVPRVSPARLGGRDS